MLQVEEILELVDTSLGTKRRRHVIGGILMSVSLLFAGLATTIITLKSEDGRNGSN